MNTDGLKDKVKGLANQAKGEVKDDYGKATDNKSLQAEGKLDKLKGVAQEKLGELKDKINR
ncbi:uncharacterized protein YjbJ (UPF0337 family) [Paenibacillus endophyticus]|uniref:Uncharacterized protein YjbJ (UPF0337 family) n=1 Tax=Paenibacillus endophyticus TaxID=1294268 RepID=A0A7W5CBA5_9BACL|nr:CsbD family protein [Paenibacillus endophyticus]MBB3154019.1 uncharacterized protein YjbJ (UPF0337 family) [Paenibacillus endophyticus]